MNSQTFSAWVEFRAFGGQGDERHVGRDLELWRGVPARLAEEQDGVAARRYILGDFSQMQVHRLAVAKGQNEPDAFAFLGANRAKYVGFEAVR
jgi:hypothetical protein